MSGQSSTGLTQQAGRFKERMSSVFFSSAKAPPRSQLSVLQEQSPPTYLSPRSYNALMETSTRSNVNDNTIADHFMKDLLMHTIIGAEFDSCDHYPPLRCNQGTRITIIQRCLDFIGGRIDEEKLWWVVGPAGVGKSTIMHAVAAKTASDSSVFATVFLSFNGRQNGTEIIMTIAYQFAVRWRSYRQFIRDEINFDPSLLRKSLSAQFHKFIVEPIMLRHLSRPDKRLPVIIDGLDECNDPLMQQEFLELISDFCLSYPTSPIAWVVASRPEPHITSFFERVEIQTMYRMERISVDSTEAYEDVQQYLRDELNKIKFTYQSLKRKPEWPSMSEFTEIATAAGGLFAYASAVVRYIDDPHRQAPATQLRSVVDAIRGSARHDFREGGHPLAPLFALYGRIVWKVPAVFSADTKKLLLLSVETKAPFRWQCNFLGLTEDAAYAALRPIYSVARVPGSDKADDESLEFFHESFKVYLSYVKWSGFTHNHEAEELFAQCSLRIVEQLSDDSHGIPTGDEVMKYEDLGYLKGGPGVCNSVSLSWPNDGHFTMTDDELRLSLYINAITTISLCFRAGVEAFVNISCFRVLITRFALLGIDFPFLQVRDFAFDIFRYQLIEWGTMKEVPLGTLDFAAICGPINLQLRVLTDVGSTSSWNFSCGHEKEEIRGGWSTSFGRYEDDIRSGDEDAPSSRGVESDAVTPRFNLTAGNDFHWGILGEESLWAPKQCKHCLQRLARHFVDHPGRLATVFVDSTELCYVDLSFVDPGDGVLLWRYRFFHSGSPTT